MSGIKLTAGGVEINDEFVSGPSYGVEIYGGSGTVTNQSGGSFSVSAAEGVGVILEDGGSVTNDQGASISGGRYAVYIFGAEGTVTNSGTISASGHDSVRLADGGDVENETGGTIGASSIAVNAIYILGGAGTVTNAGTIYGGVWLETSGNVTNQSGAIIKSSDASGGYGVGLHAGGSLSNYGSISGLNLGVELDAGGTITNHSGGSIGGTYAGVLVGMIGSSAGGGTVDNLANATISGDTGVYAFAAGASVTNAGAITGSTATRITVQGHNLTLGNGVSLENGGSLTNEVGGTVTGANYGVWVYGGVGKIINYGTIKGIGDGAKYQGQGILVWGSKASGSYVTNEAGATISASGYNMSGVYLNIDGTVTNAGSITAVGKDDAGVGFTSGGSLTNSGTIDASGVSDSGVWSSSGGIIDNLTGGSITSEAGDGIHVNSGVGDVTNAGTIGGSFNGVSLEGGGALTNQSGGTIRGVNDGVYLRGGGSVTNAGSIGGGADAIVFAGLGADALTLQTGSRLTGNVSASTLNGGNSSLILQGAGSASNLFQNFNTLDVEATGVWTLGGADTFGVTDVLSGALDSTAGFTGPVYLAGGASASFQGAFTGDVTFQGSAITLSLAQADSGIIDGFGDNDVIDLTSLAYSDTSSSYMVTPVSGTNEVDVAITEGSASYSLLFAQNPILAQGELTLAEDSNGGTNILFSPTPLPPVLANPTTADYRVTLSPVAIDPSLTVVDPDSQTLASASVAITSGFLAGDQLNFANQNGISGAYNGATGVLTLTGVATQTQYQAALDAITFSSTAADPTNAGADTSRTLTLSVNDGATTSTPVTSTVDVVSGALTFVWTGASGGFGAASSWLPSGALSVSGPPTSLDTADFNSAASVDGSGVASNLYFNAPVTISAPLATTVGGAAVIGKTAIGSVTVSSTWDATGYLQVGGVYAGTLSIGAGGDVVNSGSTSFVDGKNAGAAGLISVSGGGQLNMTSSNSSSAFTLGALDHSSGVMNISGAGSSVTIADGITVGAPTAAGLASGQITVSGGATLTTATPSGNNYSDLVGWNSHGSVTVTGPGSKWTSGAGGNIDIGGPYGDGSLIVSDGGDVEAQGGFWLGPGGTLSVDAASELQSGTGGSNTLGAITVDPNSPSAGGLGVINANVIDNGWMGAQTGGSEIGIREPAQQKLVVNGDVTGTGSLGIGEGDTLELNGSVQLSGSNSGIGFNGWYGVLEIDDAADFKSTLPIWNFNPTDTIDLTNVAYDPTKSSYSFGYGTSGADLAITEGSLTVNLDVNSSFNLSNSLTLKADASGKGTEVVYTNTPAAPFQLWGGTLPNLFSTSSGPVDGQDWSITDVTNGGWPIWVATSTPASAFGQSTAGGYSIEMTSGDWLGAEQPEVPIATYTNFVDPFNTSNRVGNLAAPVIFTSANNQGSGALLYWAPSATAGDYALDLQAITTTYVGAPATSPNTVLNGAPVTMISALAAPTSWNFTASSTGLVVGYTTQASATTENIWFQAFSAAGAPTTAAVEIASGVADGTQYYVGLSNGVWYYRYTIVNGASTGLWGGTFSATSGAVGAMGEIDALPSFTAITGVASRNLSNSDTLRVFEGQSNGDDVLEGFLNNFTTSTAPTFTIKLASDDDQFAIANVTDPNDGQQDYTVVAYTDANQVHLDLLNESGAIVGSDFVVPGLASFDRIHTLTTGDADDDTRVEIDYTVADPNGGSQVEAVIYDTAANAYYYTLGGGGNGEYIGSPFDDFITDAPGTYTVNGGGGTDTLQVNYASNQVSISKNAADDVIVTTPGGVTTLEQFSNVQLSDALINVSSHWFIVQYNATITGAGTQWSTAGDFNVGGGFDTSVVVSDGGAIVAGGGLDLAGPASSYLTIESGGTATSGGDVYGGGAPVDTVGVANAGSNNNVSVTGAGSSWKMAARLFVNATGSVSATNGGWIRAADGVAMVSGSFLSADGSSTFESGSQGGATAGFLTIDAGSDITGAGTVVGAIEDNGVIASQGGTLTLSGAVSGVGSLDIGSSSEVALNDQVRSTVGVDFQGAKATLDINHGVSVGGPISGFGADDSIDMAALLYNVSSSSVSITAGASPNTYVATFTDGPSSYSLTFDQSTPVKAGEFKLSDDGNGGTLATYTTPPNAPTPYDFNGDGMSDILFRDAASGETYLWGMNGTNVIAGAPTGAQVGNNWQIGGVGDFNGDGQADLLWEYDNTANAADPLNGISYISIQNGAATAATGSGVVEQLSTNWRVAGVGNFTGGGTSDILYRYENSANSADPLNGDTYIDMMNGSQINWATSGFTSQQEIDPNWNVVAVADFTGSGNADILWQYDNTANAADPLNGTLYEWRMNGTSVSSAGLLSAQPGSANWKVEGTGDFDGNGTADILFRYEDAANAADPLNGITYIDFMNGTNVTGGSTTSWQIDNSWQVAGIGDYNGDGKADILFQQTSTGSTYIWEMNGASVASGGLTNEQTGLGWSVQNGVHIQG